MMCRKMCRKKWDSRMRREVNRRRSATKKGLKSMKSRALDRLLGMWGAPVSGAIIPLNMADTASATHPQKANEKRENSPSCAAECVALCVASEAGGPL